MERVASRVRVSEHRCVKWVDVAELKARTDSRAFRGIGSGGGGPVVRRHGRRCQVVRKSWSI